MHIIRRKPGNHALMLNSGSIVQVSQCAIGVFDMHLRKLGEVN